MKKITSLFYETSSGNKPVREWLLSLDKEVFEELAARLHIDNLFIEMPILMLTEEGIQTLNENSSLTTIEDDKFYIFPNPCVDYIYTNSKLYNQCEYKLIDQFGKIILQGVLQENKLNVSALPKGVYILQCTLADKTQRSFSIFKI